MFGINRRSALLAGLAASISVPYMWNNPKMQSYVGEAKNWMSSKSGNAVTNTSATDANGNLIPGSTAPPDFESSPDLGTLPTTLEGSPVADFGEVIRFDVDPRWVTERWSRVTTVLAEYSLEGLRVPFVSGTKLDDIAGAMTYYYDKNHRLQRITLHGYTGDERRLAGFVQRTFGLGPTPSLYAGLYLTQWNGQPKSALIVRLAPVVVSAAPHNRLEVLLEINRPNDYYALSGDFRELLNQGKKNERWGW